MSTNFCCKYVFCCFLEQISILCIGYKFVFCGYKLAFHEHVACTNQHSSHINLFILSTNYYFVHFMNPQFAQISILWALISIQQEQMGILLASLGTNQHFVHINLFFEATNWHLVGTNDNFVYRNQNFGSILLAQVSIV